MALTITAVECSTYVITVAFTDDETPANSITPSTFHWSLVDSVGTVINGRSDVSETPASIVSIVLTGADLEIAGYKNARRFVTVWGLFNASYGSNLNYSGEIELEIEKTKGPLPTFV